MLLIQDFLPTSHKVKAKPAGNIISTNANSEEAKADGINSRKDTMEKNNDDDDHSVNRTSSITLVFVKY